MRMMILSFLMMSSAGCATAGAQTGAAPESAQAKKLVKVELAREHPQHPRGVERLRRELFVLERGRKLATIGERILHFQSVSRSLGVAPESTVAQSIVDLAQRHALAREQLTDVHGRMGEELESVEDGVDAAIADLDVRSGQLALQLTFLTMN